MASLPFAPHRQRGSVELNVLYVGQGDSLFLVFPAGHTILVDGGGSFGDPAHRGGTHGPDPGEKNRCNLFMVARIPADRRGRTDARPAGPHRRPHGNFGNLKVNTLWSGRAVASLQQAQLEKLAISYGARVVHELRGYHCDFDGAHRDFLWPQIVPENSTIPDFIAAVRPRLAVISSGEENPYGHPSPQLIRTPASRWCSDVAHRHQTGAVHIPTDGNHLEVSCFVTVQINSTKPQTPQDQQSNQQQ
jgi:hypothetical protein